MLIPLTETELFADRHAAPWDCDQGQWLIRGHHTDPTTIQKLLDTYSAAPDTDQFQLTPGTTPRQTWTRFTRHETACYLTTHPDADPKYDCDCDCDYPHHEHVAETDPGALPVTWVQGQDPDETD